MWQARNDACVHLEPHADKTGRTLHLHAHQPPLEQKTFPSPPTSTGDPGRCALHAKAPTVARTAEAAVAHANIATGKVVNITRISTKSFLARIGKVINRNLITYHELANLGTIKRLWYICCSPP